MEDAEAALLPFIDDSEDDSVGDVDADMRADKSRGRRLWDSRLLFPAGVDKWDNAGNCEAALGFECPCGNRCLSRVGDVVRLYEHRKKLRTHVGKNARSGALRDTLRDRLSEHYDAGLGRFSDSFVVSGVGGLCARGRT